MRLFGYYSRHWIPLLVLATILIAHFWAFLQPQWRRKYGAVLVGHALLVTLSAAIGILPRLRSLNSSEIVDWFRGLTMLSGVTSIAVIAVASFFLYTASAPKTTGTLRSGRRQFLQAAQGAMIAAPALVACFAVITRNRYEVREVDVPVKGLLKDLNGLRLLQLSDIHMSSFLTARDVERVVDIANETRPHLALITGDQITGPRDSVEDCLRQLARLKADGGIWGCMGNHEIVAECEQETEMIGAGLGIRFLRQQNVKLRFGEATLNLAGVDYQPFNLPYLLETEKLIVPGLYNILLSHNPDVFPVAAMKGFDLTIAGHTHGGQITVEILQQWANAARFFTPYVRGYYRKGESALYVTRGIGTIGIPARVGAPPEITVLRLCAS